jgi:hypothetical protein
MERKMKRGITLKQYFTQAQIDAAIAAAPERVDDPDSPYDMNDPEAIHAYWSKAILTFPGGHPHQNPLWKTGGLKLHPAEPPEEPVTKQPPLLAK